MLAINYYIITLRVYVLTVLLWPVYTCDNIFHMPKIIVILFYW